MRTFTLLGDPNIEAGPYLEHMQQILADRDVNVDPCACLCRIFLDHGTVSSSMIALHNDGVGSSLYSYAPGAPSQTPL
ncbi:MAG: hypothetical protein VX733_14920 [Candidatus Latescibacterota bacterium]|nr:hypothetical protein [Candidatus Latescibacterota bacterium]